MPGIIDLKPNNTRFNMKKIFGLNYIIFVSIRPMKIDIMFLVHNFQKFGAGFFSFFISFHLLVNNFLDPVKTPIKI